MSPQIKYAYKTHNTWIYRRVYPKPLQPLLGTALNGPLAVEYGEPDIALVLRVLSRPT